MTDLFPIQSANGGNCQRQLLCGFPILTSFLVILSIPGAITAWHIHAAAAAAKSLQLCLTVRLHRRQPTRLPGILQARTLEWVAISFSNAGKWKVKVKPLSCVRLLETPWTTAHQAPPSMGFSRQEDWSGVPLPSPHIHARNTQIHASISDLSPVVQKYLLYCLDYARTSQNHL